MKATGSKLMKITEFSNGRGIVNIFYDTDTCKYLLMQDNRLLVESKEYDQLADLYANGSFKTLGDFNV